MTEVRIKRKAIVVQNTKCRACDKVWLDKIYDEPVHRVICPYCGMLQATIEIDDCLEEICMQGIRYDIGQQGAFGSHFDKRGMIKMLKKKYGEEGARTKFWEMYNAAQAIARENKILPPSGVNLKKRIEND